VELVCLLRGLVDRAGVRVGLVFCFLGYVLFAYVLLA
jgi:hypothetical protein